MLNFTSEAFNELENMRNHVLMVRNFYGDKSPEFMKVSDSFGHVMFNLVRLGGNVYRDGELSLLGSNDYMTYGVIWFGDSNSDGPEVGEWSIHS